MKVKKLTLTLLILAPITLISLLSFNSKVISIKNKPMTEQEKKYGIDGQVAPELDKNIAWVDGEGKEISPVQLADYEGKFKVIYCFQSWCPGCHSAGLPSLQKMTAALADNENMVFLAVQTVFEGAHANTKEKMLEVQKKYELSIPFGHDMGTNKTNHISSIMYHYRTGGTPWFIFIAPDGKVLFNDYHVNTEKAIEYLKSIK